MARLRGNRWQADALIEGRRCRKSFATEALANAWAAQHAPPERLPADTAPETLSTLSTALAADLWGRGDQAIVALRHVKQAITIIGDIPIGQFRSIHVERLTSAYLAEGVSESTINRRYASLSKLCKRAVETERLNRMPVFKRRREPEGRKRYLTPAEEDRVFAAVGRIDQGAQDIAVFLVDTGARLGEAFSLKNHQLDMDRGTITFDNTKADLTRTVAMTTRVRALLTRRGDLSAPFSDVNRWTFRDHWNRGRAAAGFKDDPLIVPHILRHTCASRISQAGLSPKLIQQQLGHKTAAMTDRYSHLAPDAHQQVLATLELRGQAGVAKR